jgi:hypothetical protein
MQSWERPDSCAQGACREAGAQLAKRTTRRNASAKMREKQTMRRGTITRIGATIAVLSVVMTAIAPAFAAKEVLKRHTDVKLTFDNALSSKTAEVGQVVWFHVEDPVIVDGRTVIAAGTKVKATIVRVRGRARYGVNARIQMDIRHIRCVDGTFAPIGYKTKNLDYGTRTGEASAATIGGEVLLGPVGLIGGYFIMGKQLNVKPGDKMTVEVQKDTTVHVK